jgi:hypothetical protein
MVQWSINRDLLHPNFEGYKLTTHQIVQYLKEYALSECILNFVSDENSAWYRFEDATVHSVSSLEETRFLSRLNHLLTQEEATAEATSPRHFWFFTQRTRLMFGIIHPTSLDTLHLEEINLPHPTSFTPDKKKTITYPPSACLLSRDKILASNGQGSLSRIFRDEIGLSISWQFENFLSGNPFVVLSGFEASHQTACLVVLGRFLNQEAEIMTIPFKSSSHYLNMFEIYLFEIHNNGMSTLLNTMKCRHSPDIVQFHINPQGIPFLYIFAKDVCFSSKSYKEETEDDTSSRFKDDPSEVIIRKEKEEEKESSNDNIIDREDLEQQQQEPQPKHAYVWSQNFEDITVSIPWTCNLDSSAISIQFLPDSISLAICGSMIWKHVFFYDCIVVDESTWFIEGDDKQTLSLSLTKSARLRWPHLFKYHDGIVETKEASELNEDPNAPIVLNPFDRIEEIDYHEEQTIYIHVINLDGTILATHKCTSSEMLCQSFNARPNYLPLIGIQYNVDTVLMKCDTSQAPMELSLSHQGTLCAFSYVQASKRDRKFTHVTSDAMYALISEHERNVFVYKQPDIIGKDHHGVSRRSNHAAQEIITSKYPDAEILGIQALSDRLCVILTSVSLAFFQLH